MQSTQASRVINGAEPGPAEQSDPQTVESAVWTKPAEMLPEYTDGALMKVFTDAWIFQAVRNRVKSQACSRRHALSSVACQENRTKIEQHSLPGRDAQEPMCVPQEAPLDSIQHRKTQPLTAATPAIETRRRISRLGPRWCCRASPACVTSRMRTPIGGVEQCYHGSGHHPALAKKVPRAARTYSGETPDPAAGVQRRTNGGKPIDDAKRAGRKGVGRKFRVCCPTLF